MNLIFTKTAAIATNAMQMLSVSKSIAEVKERISNSIVQLMELNYAAFADSHMKNANVKACFCVEAEMIMKE